MALTPVILINYAQASLIMFHQVFILCLFFSSGLHFTSASNFFLKKPSTLKSKFFGTPKIAPDLIETSHEERKTVNPLLSSHQLKLKRSSLELLADSLLQIILEALFDDHSTIRLISKSFRKIFDDLVFATCWLKFPGFTKETFSHWNDENPTKVKNKYLKYQLIPLVRVLNSNIKPIVDCYEKSETRLDLSTYHHLKCNAVPFIRLIDPEYLNIRLELANVFLKLRLASWVEIYVLFFLERTWSLSIVCSLGLTTLAHELANHNLNEFIEFVGPEDEGLLEAVKAQKYATSRFIIHFLRCQSHSFTTDDKHYLNYVISELIKSKYWNLLKELYEMNKENVASFHIINITTLGCVEGLRALRGLAKQNSVTVASLAASMGHLEFLKEFDSLGLLKKSCYSAIHEAALNGRTECLEFLVSRFGTKYLGIEDKSGYMPIHLAARSPNSETLRVILRLYPYYKSGFLRLRKISPLHMALWYLSSENARILIGYFPELINFKTGDNSTVFHLAILSEDSSILSLLLNYATPELITARNSDGNTALHLACQNRISLENIDILMNTGLFNAMERNNNGLTPVDLFIKHNHSQTSDLMRIFKFQSEEELREAMSK